MPLVQFGVWSSSHVANEYKHGDCDQTRKECDQLEEDCEDERVAPVVLHVLVFPLADCRESNQHERLTLQEIADRTPGQGRNLLCQFTQIAAALQGQNQSAE